MEARWREGMTRARATLDEVGREVHEFGPRWDDPAWGDRPLPLAVPPVLRFGEVRIGLDQLPRGVPSDPRLREGVPASFTFPALVPFPDRANLVVEAPAEGLRVALGVLQSAMLRLLTSLPPGQVRFTIVDPVGIGRNFGAFMHLADFDEALVTGQVWTEPRQIEERLADLSVHMEKVTQRYLRNEYATIGEYNAVAGEVAEPYRVLVIADFPTNLDEKALSRLAGIVAGGVPCGVLTLIAVDRDRPLPDGITLEDLRASAVALHWEDGRLVWTDPDFGRYPLTLDPPPAADFTNRLVQAPARRPGGPSASRSPSSSSRRPPKSGGPGTAAPGSTFPWERPAPPSGRHLTLGEGHFAARPDRRQDGLRQVDAVARPDHEPRAAITAPTRSSCT